MQNKTLKERTTRAIVWSFVDKFGQQGLNLVIGVILARYFLSPSDYGLIGLIVVFNALGYLLIDGGFSNALIRKQDVTPTDLSSVFYFNVAISLLVYSILFLCAPFIAMFYERPILTILIRVMALGIPLSALSLIQVTLLSKAINFKLLARTNLIALFCSGSLSLFLAWKGCGVWVLVIQPLVNTIVRNICLWTVSAWRPAAVYSKQSIKALWEYSSKLLASSALSIVFNNIYAILIGKLYLLNDVGYYTQANKYSELPYATIMPAIQVAVYPAMANIGDNDDPLKKVFRKTIRVSAFVYLPVMLGLIAVAEPLIQIMLGTKWLPIVPYMQLLCFGYIFSGMASLYINILYTKGLSSAVLKVNIFYRSLQALSIIITLHSGIIALLIAWNAVSVIYALFVALYAGKKIHYRFFEQMKDSMPYFVLALVMGAGVFLLPLLITNSIVLLCTQVIAGASFYLGATYLLGSKVFREVIEIIKRRGT